MAFILSLETSTRVCSTAIHDDGRLVATSEVHIAQSAASRLALLIADLEKTSGIALKQVQAIAVSAGPGSYTGLRIGASTAKGLCYALDIPLISINTLDAMAYQVNQYNFDKAFLCPMIDARRMEVYCQVLDEKLKVEQTVEAKIVDETSFSEFLLKRKVIFFGDGADKCVSVIKNDNALFIKNIFPSSAQIGFLAHQKYHHNQFEDLVTYEPFYLKDFLVKKASVSA